MDKFHRLVLEEIEAYHYGNDAVTYVIANVLWREHRQDIPYRNRASLTPAVLRACKTMTAGGLLSAKEPRYPGCMWQFSLTDAGRDELDENNTHCLFCEKLIKPGEPCHRGGGSADGEIACEACAPTWEQIREPGFWCDLTTGEPVSPGQVEIDIAKHLAAGGKITDKIVEPY